MGKNNLLLAAKELQTEGLSFNLTYSRGPFQLMGSQASIDADRRRKGLPKDAPNHMVWPRKEGEKSHMDQLMEDAGLSPRNTAVTDFKDHAGHHSCAPASAIRRKIRE